MAEFSRIALRFIQATCFHRDAPLGVYPPGWARVVLHEQGDHGELDEWTAYAQRTLHLLAEFGAEVDALKGQVRARVILLACDQALDPRGPWVFESWEPAKLPTDLKGGGGTRFTPVFDWIEGERLRPALLIYFTDGEGEFPEREPDYPVVWLVKGRAPVPWRERLQLN